MHERAAEKHTTLTRNLSDTLPGVNRASEGSVDLVAAMILDVLGNDATDLVTVIDTHMVRPMTTLPIRLLVFAILFALVSIGVSALSNATHLVDYISIVGRINTLLGAALGLTLAALVIFITAIAVNVIISLTGDNIIFVNSMTVEQTYLFRHVYNIGFLNFA
jgi:hypothetical protein